MNTVNFKYGALIHGRQNNMGAFNAVLNPRVRNRETNADLTLFVRVHFKQINPTAASKTYRDSDNKDVPIRKWKPKEWNLWKTQFIGDCQRKWNGKFWLRTPKTYNGLNWPASSATHRCNIYCKFKISEQSNAEGAHAVIPVVKISKKHFFRSNMLLYDSQDLKPLKLTAKSKFLTHLHEIGHLIGLDHPGEKNPGCVAGDEAVCYASPKGNDKGVMGRGSRIYARHAQPWIKAVAIMTETPEFLWKASRKRIYPKKL